MRRLRDVPIRHKLVAIIMLTSAAALIVASGTLILVDQTLFRQDLSNDLETLASVLADNSTAAVAFVDEQAAVEILDALRVQPNIEAACLYDLRAILARYVRPGADADCPFPPGQIAAVDDSFSVVRPIVLDNRQIGTIYVRSDLRQIADRLNLQLVIALAVLLGAGGVALLMSSWLQKMISAPIRDLAQTMQAVSDQDNYRMRATKHSTDEMGRLVDSFNLMLTQIEERDAQLRAAKATLETRVQERTEELRDQLEETRRTQEALVKANEELMQSNRELDDFAYIASHDLKEPLRGISSYAAFLEEDYGDKLDTEGLGRLKTVGRLSQRMDALIDTLLHYSRVGRLELAYQRVDLNEILRDVAESLRVRLAELNVEIRIPRSLPVEYCDRALVGEVFQNLITNAAKYNDQLAKWVEIGFREQRKGNIYYVRDNGIGIPAKHHDAIFRIFKRLHGRDKFGGGTGAGLTIVRKIIERHHGRLWLESKEGEGTTFFFTLTKVDQG